MTFALAPHQIEAIRKLATGKVLVGDVGSGKSITALAYAQEAHPGKRIIIITTAKKRDKGEWFSDAMEMSLRTDIEVDSWNNIQKYEGVENAFFILDEQRIVGKGAWVKAFWTIAKKNDWILLSATPADMWIDLMPIFVANGFYRNQTEFYDTHVVWSRFSKYPKIDRYIEEWYLIQCRDKVYVEMPFNKHTTREEHIVKVDFSLEEQKTLFTARWNFYEDKPLKDAGEMMRYLRMSSNSHPSRFAKIVEIAQDHPRLIIFYNHNYELEILRCLHTELDIPVAEWNGKNHQDVPSEDRWIYLVQYQAGSEGWNCITTDAMAFYSLPYSYRNFAQAKGRIDRMNTPYQVLHYFILKSDSIIDRSIWKALNRKKNFQASAFAKKAWPKEERKVRPLN